MNLVALAVASVLLAQTPAAPQPPKAPRRPVAETHHGVEVVDPYRWLEDSRSPEVKEWTEAQAGAARAWLDALPHAKEIREQVRQIVVSRSPSWYGLAERKGTWFAMRSDPARQQPVLLRISGWGHGIGSSRDETIAQQSDVWAFFFAELGVPFRPIAVAAPR
jgi:prolyl oligopeptidase